MKILRLLLIGSGVLLTAVFMGLVAAVAPPGVIARFGVVIFGVFALLVAWGFRHRARGETREAWLDTLSSFVVMMSIAWPPYVFFSAGGLPKVNPFTLSVSFGLVLLGFCMIYRRGFYAQHFAVLREIRWPMVLFGTWIVWRFICTAASKNPVAGNVGMLRELVFTYGVFFYALILCQRGDGIQGLARIVVGCTLFVAGAGLLEAIEGKNRFAPLAGVADAGESGSAVASIIGEKIRGGAFRAQSVFSHPVVFGQYLGGAAPIVFIAALLDKNRLWRLIALVTLPLILLGVYKSGSRSGLLALAVSGAILLGFLWVRIVVSSRKYRGFALAAVPVVLVLFSFVYGFGEQLVLGKSSVEHSSSLVRVFQMHTAMRAIGDSPLMGFGQGAANGIAGVIGGGGVLTMDVYYIDVLLQAGWPGAVLFLLMVSTSIVVVMREFSRSVADSRYYLPAFGAAMVSVLVTSIGVGTSSNMLLMALCMAAVAASRKESRVRETAAAQVKADAGRALAAAVQR
ncbi:O-antigen ligase family protein [Oxalobacteraceae bacterium]|nr:O-antigen ligase family protein [Oxalobacteraceae bacterium]